MTEHRTDVHRPSVVDPAAYSYVGTFDADFPGEEGERLAATVEASATSVYRDRRRCDHCGAHLRYAVVWRHEPSREHVCTGEICARETMRVPDRLTLDLKRLKDGAASRKLYPEAVRILDRYAKDGGPNPFVRDVAGRFAETGWLSEKQAEAVVNADGREVTPGHAADRADIRRRERGHELKESRKARRVGAVRGRGKLWRTLRGFPRPRIVPLPGRREGTQVQARPRSALRRAGAGGGGREEKGRRVSEIERHPVEITPAALELLQAHGRTIAEIAAQFARDREAEGGGENVRSYYCVGPTPNESVGARFAPSIGKTIIWRHGEMDFDPDDLAAVEDQRPGGWGPETWTG